jgi:hypothetical protein
MPRAKTIEPKVREHEAAKKQRDWDFASLLLCVDRCLPDEEDVLQMLLA